MDISDERLSSSLNDVLNKNNIRKVNYVINCCADSHVDRSWDQVSKFIDSNIKGPLNLAKWALSHGVGKFVQVSTDEVWGGSPQPYTESSEFRPENIYSSSKASAELFLENFKKAYNLPLVITNGANTYGFRQMPEKIIPKTINKIIHGEKVPLYKTPAQRMWLHVEDHSSGIIAAMEKGVVGQKYCLSPEKNNEWYTHDLVKKICEIMNKSYEDSVDIVEDRLNYDLRYFMLNEKSKKDLDWFPHKNIENELEKVVAWYIQNFEEKNEF
jgi:dTDP-glucose 4,6-dehydratase